nr:prolipoprotein diacylglyceryl transferase family protein [Kofleriaceae bacterium]
MNPRVIDWLDNFLPHVVSSALAPTWFTCVAVAGLVALIWMLVVAKRQGIDRGAIASVVLWVYVSAVVAGIAMPMLIDAVQSQVATGHVRIHWAGMTSFWGYLAGLVAIVVVCRDHGLPIARLGDLAAAPIGLALALVRVGCFLGGCDYGKVTSAPWAVRFPAGSPAWHDQVNAGLLPADRLESLPVHPTELYESLLGVAMCVLACVLVRRKLREGRVFLAVCALYAVGRIFNETLRADAGRGIYGGLSSGQIFCGLVLIAIGASVLRPRRVHAALATAVAAVMLLVVGVGDADAQTPPPSAPTQPQAVQPQPPPQPPPAPMSAQDPYAPAQPAVAPAGTATAASPAATDEPRSLVVGATAGFAVPIDRRQDQVPMLAGGSLSVGYRMPRTALWLDYQSFANVDATHATVLLAASFEEPVAADKLHLGARAGFGATFVNFHDPAFADVTGTTLRIEADLEYDASPSWVIWARPMTFDWLYAPDLGGPIVTYQMSAGVGYRFGHRHSSAPHQAATAPPPQPPPAQPYPPPYPQAPPPPFPVPGAN